MTNRKIHVEIELSVYEADPESVQMGAMRWLGEFYFGRTDTGLAVYLDGGVVATVEAEEIFRATMAACGPAVRALAATQAEKGKVNP